MMEKYITVEQAKSAVDYAVELSPSDWEKVVDEFDDLPTADVEEVHYSEWVEDENGNCFCKKCLHPILHNYHEDRVYSPRCWFCGARMDGER